MTDETVTSEMLDAGVKAAGKYWQRFSKEREMVEAIFAAMRNVERAESIRNCFREMHGGEPIIASEMIEAGVCAGREHWLADRASRKGEAKAIYLAMRALDPEVERMREALERLVTMCRRAGPTTDIYATLDEDSLGFAMVPATNEGGNGCAYPIRDELLAQIDAALNKQESGNV